MSWNRGDRRLIDIYRYRSESELHDQWRGLDVPRGQDRLTAVFALNEDLHCNIRDLIQRRQVASRLTIVPTLRRWPSLESPVDRMLATSELGWNSIDVCRDIGQALESGFAALDATNGCPYSFRRSHPLSLGFPMHPDTTRCGPSCKRGRSEPCGGELSVNRHGIVETVRLCRRKIIPDRQPDSYRFASHRHGWIKSGGTSR